MAAFVRHVTLMKSLRPCVNERCSLRDAIATMPRVAGCDSGERLPRAKDINSVPPSLGGEMPFMFYAPF